MDIQQRMIRFSLQDSIRILDASPLKSDLIAQITAIRIMNRASIAHLGIERAFKAPGASEGFGDNRVGRTFKVARWASWRRGSSLSGPWAIRPAIRSHRARGIFNGLLKGLRAQNTNPGEKAGRAWEFFGMVYHERSVLKRGRDD